MTTANTPQPYRTQVLDWLFTHYEMQASGRQAQDVPVAAAGNVPAAEPESPPPIKDAADLRAANEWLQRERQRLQQYTEMQLARIRAEHQALVSQVYNSEQKMILGCQELSRKEELLTRQNLALQQQAAELSQRERALAGQLEQWSQVQGDLAGLCQTRVRTEEETAQQQALLKTLRDETIALQKSRAATQAELEAMARALDEQREARSKEQALTRAGQAQMDKRLRDLDRAEHAAQRRLAELDDLEARLRQEFEEQELQLADQRRDIAALYARLRQRLQEGSGGPGDQVASADLQG